MCDDDSKGIEGLQALQRILEDAIEAGADAVELEYVDDGLEICCTFGNMGWGHVLTERGLIGQVIETVVEKANLEKRPRGKMHIDLFGKQQTIIVEEYESFGESVFRLILKESRRKRR